MRLLPRTINAKASATNLPKRRIRHPSSNAYQCLSTVACSGTVKRDGAPFDSIKFISSRQSPITCTMRSYSSETSQKPLKPPSKSSSSSQSTSPTAKTSDKEDMDVLLVTAFNQARDISEMVKRKQLETKQKSPKSSTPQPPKSPPKTITIVEPFKFNSPEEALEQTKQKWNIDAELSAAEVLMKITGHPSFAQALAQKRNQRSNDNMSSERDVALSLHNSFLAVIHWMCVTLSTCPPLPMNGLDDTFAGEFHQFDISSQDGSKAETAITVPAPTKASVLLTQLFQLTERAHCLNLPLTIPLYQTIAALTARYSSSSDVSYIILDMSTQMRDILAHNQKEVNDETEANASRVVQASFFAPALKELLIRNRLRDMVNLLHGIKNIHGISSVDLTTGMELLSLLNTHVEELIKGDGSSTGTLHGTLFDEDDAMEVAILLQQPVMEELDSKKKELEEYKAHYGTSLMDILEDEEDQEDQEDQEDWDEVEEFKEEDGDSELHDDVEKLNDIVESMTADNISVKEREAEMLADQLFEKLNRPKSDKAVTNATQPADLKVRFHVNQSTGNIENIDLMYVPAANREVRDKIKEWQKAFLREMVYIREPDSWELPDIVPQLMEWNSGQELLFSKEYERHLMNEIAKEENFPTLDEDDEIIPELK